MSHRMNRRQLAFIILLNAFISIVVSSCVFWIVEQRRPDVEELAAILTPVSQTGTVSTVGSTDNFAISSSGNASSENSGAATSSNTSTQPAELAPSTPQPIPNNNAVGGNTYVVQAGDSLTGIANQFGLTIDQLLNINNLDNPDFVFVGQQLILPAGSTSSTQPVQQPVANTQPSRVVNGTLQVTEVSGQGTLASEIALVVNESDAPFNLQGWTLGREGGPIYTFGNLPIFPGGSVRIHSKAGNDTSIDLHWGQPNAVWSTGSVARLVNVQGELVHTFTVK